MNKEQIQEILKKSDDIIENGKISNRIYEFDLLDEDIELLISSLNLTITYINKMVAIINSEYDSTRCVSNIVNNVCTNRYAAMLNRLICAVEREENSLSVEIEVEDGKVIKQQVSK